MQLKEIISSLEVTPFYFDAIIAVAFILMILSFVAVLALDKDDGLKQPIALTLTIVFLVTGIGVLAWTENAKDNASKEAKVSRVNDKIRISSDSEFMKSVDLDVVAEKDGYIYVEFDNKTYRIEDLSKKGS